MAENVNQDSSNGNEDSLTFVYRTMQLDEGITYKLISDTDMVIDLWDNEIKVPANNVIIFKPTTDDVDPHVRINEHLGKDFVTGWNKLPNEVRLDIIGYLVHANGPTYHPDNFSIDHPLSLARRSIPYIAQNAEAEYYKHNTFRIDRTNDYLLAAALPHVLTRVRTLYIDNRFFSRSNFWSVIQQIANGTTGFTNLKYLTLQINFRRGGSDADYWKPEEPVELKCKGKIFAIDEPFRRSWLNWGVCSPELQQTVSRWVVFKP